MSSRILPYQNKRDSKGLVRPLILSKKPLPGKGVLSAVKKDFDFLRQNISFKERGFGFLMSQVYSSDSGFIAGPYFGAPHAVAVLESLVCSGADNILAIGWCGSLSSDLKLGDLIIPSSFEYEDSTYKSYALDEEIKFDSDFQVKIKKSLNKNNILFKEEKIWTTNAIFRETREKIDFFKNKGSTCVEMENSALYHAAKFLNINLICINIVSDFVSGKKWVQGFKSKEFNESRKKIINWAADYVRK
ncbi:MAG: nucleoside phosphorylase [Desulforegulaceae bacterium]|nr:nucleoside phosphorylase [Desulforegulaceae bacterium]